MRISDWSSDVCSSDLKVRSFSPDQELILDAHEDYWGGRPPLKSVRLVVVPEIASRVNGLFSGQFDFICDMPPDQIPGIEKNAKFEVQGGLIANHRLTVFDKHHPQLRSEEHTSELQSLMRISYAVFCLKKKTNTEKQKRRRSRN